MPTIKAMATDRKMETITFSDSDELTRLLSSRLPSDHTFSVASMTVPPNSSKTSDTVVEVGMPSVLNTSSTITSVTMTARKTVITSWNE